MKDYQSEDEGLPVPMLPEWPSPLFRQTGIGRDPVAQLGWQLGWQLAAAGWPPSGLRVDGRSEVRRVHLR